jgi:hypothetical protein
MSGNTDGIEQEEEQQFGLPDLHVSQRADEPRPAPVAPEIREFLAALVLNIAACRHWLSADPPDIRQARATMDRPAYLSAAFAPSRHGAARGWPVLLRPPPPVAVRGPAGR